MTAAPASFSDGLSRNVFPAPVAIGTIHNGHITCAPKRHLVDALVQMQAVSKAARRCALSNNMSNNKSPPGS